MIHVPPRWFARSTNWTTVCVCTGCGLRAKAEETYENEPCPNCGARLRRDVGHWVKTTLPWWKRLLFATPDGHWELLKENLKERNTR